MRKDVIIWIGTGEIGLAIIRRIGSGKCVIAADKHLGKAQSAAGLLRDAGFDAVAIMADLSSRDSVIYMISEARRYGEVKLITPLAVDELKGRRGEFYRDMLAGSPAGRPGTADEIANVAELVLGEKGAFITGSDFLADGGATASYFYGNLNAGE